MNNNKGCTYWIISLIVFIIGVMILTQVFEELESIMIAAESTHIFVTFENSYLVYSMWIVIRILIAYKFMNDVTDAVIEQLF